MKRFFVFFVVLVSFLHAEAIDITGEGISLLDRSNVYIDEQGLTLSEVIKKDRFRPYDKKYIRTGIGDERTWLSLAFKNDTAKAEEKIILFSTPFLEHIYFYDAKNLEKPDIKGQAYPSEDHQTQQHYFKIRLEPYTTKQYYVRVHSDYNYVNFKVTLEDETDYIKKDRNAQFINIFLIGFIFALMLYSFFLFFYAGDKNYFFYGLYLIPQILLMMKLVGLTQIYFSKELILLDLQATIVRPYLLIIASSLFAIHFLDVKRYKAIYSIFIAFIVISVLAMIFLNSPDTIALRLSSILALFLVVFNLGVGIYVYSKGYKQARLYIIGFMIVFLSYIFLVTDSMGLTSLLLDYPSMLLWATAFEALILSLAFADRYNILQKEKENANKLLFNESRNRELRVSSEVAEKTKELSSAIEIKKMLLQEVHHRVKNNLQIILSIIQLQAQGVKEELYKRMLTDIANRVNAIAKTYEMLIVDDDLQQIDMKLYMESLTENISKGFKGKIQDIEIVTDIDVTLSLKEAAYIGLIANEIITNSYKYAFDEGGGIISIHFHRVDDRYTLIIEDNGKGFDINEVKDSLGIKLINILVVDQLKGELDMHSNAKTRYTIRFSLPQYDQQT